MRRQQDMIVEETNIYDLCTQPWTLLGPNYGEYIVSMMQKSPTNTVQTCQVLSPSVETEVWLLISASMPTPISTWYDYIYWRTPNKHTYNIFLAFR